MEKNIVIVGAGYSGVLIAKKLAKRIKKRKIQDVYVTLIDKNPFHTMLTELHEVAANRVEEDSVRLSLDKIFAGRKVNVVQDTVSTIDYDNRQVIGEKGAYPYDYVVLAAGSKPTFFGVPGAEEYTYTLWSYEDAVKLKDHIHDCFRKAVMTTDMEEKKKLLHFDIVGAGFTGVEMTGELAEYVPILCESFGIDRELVTIRIIDMLTRTIPTLPEKLSYKVEKRLYKMGVQILLSTNVKSIGPDYIETEKEGEVSREYTGTVIWAAGIESATLTCEVASTLPNAGRHRIKVDPYLRCVCSDNVYVAGDNMFYIPEGETQPVPQVVENCEQSAEIVAHNLLCAITETGEMKEYKPAFHGIMVSVGGRYGVARVGGAKRKINLPSFFAMFCKHFINIVYFVQVLGWNKIFSYIKHEFFTIRNRRSFVGGHFSNRTPSFLLVPLRIFLGAVWVFEGVMKIVEGWFKNPKLKGFFGGANAWYESIIKGTDGVSSGTPTASAAVDVLSAASDATSGATGAGGGEAVGKVIFNINFLGIFRAIFVSGAELDKATLADYAFKLDIPLMNTFINNVILPNSGIQLAMQIFIVLAEILVGLALMGGWFTMPASAFSLVLQFMFVATTGLYLNTFWMIFAAIAVLIGAGRTFGIDYYFMPWVKRAWKNVGWVKKSYLYHD